MFRSPRYEAARTKRQHGILICCGVLLLSTVHCATFAQEEDAGLSNKDGWVTSLAFSQDGSRIYGAGAQSLHYRPASLYQWDTSSGKRQAVLEGHPTSIWSVAVSDDGKTLISSGYDGAVWVWDLAEAKPRTKLDKHKGWCRAVALAGDGQHFATGGEDGTVVVWKSADGAEVVSFKAHEASVMQLAFSADGATLASASADGTAKLWDWKNSKETAKLEGHEDAVWSVAFGSDGTVATAGADRQVIVWDRAGNRQRSFGGHKNWITRLVFSPDGSRLASASLDGTVRLWDPSTGELVTTTPVHQSGIWSVVISSDGNWLATGTRKHGVRIWNLETGAERFAGD